ncbi:uncharacterized protein LOC119599716 [Lucilia sericata]|uniref:uncharacterized protein LOC119599716 n=1 Tax=Lucilia sericata TaxID=13632 RepID=UPI0018A7EAAA|nr:uncharacterized protein LOC119599716 [Lucilia sericata]
MGRTKCTKIIENVLCPYFKKELIADIGDSVFSLLIDESTDVSMKKQLGIVVCYYSESSRCIVNTFLKLVELEDSTASAITKAILLTLNEFNVNLKKFKGLGTDNANAMVGANKGVIAQLKKKNSNIILVPCVCHSVQLAVSSASKCMPNEIEYLISESYNWFAKSPSRQNSYQSLYLSLNNGQEPLVRACDTRWLSIEVAVKRIVDQWFELKAHFNEVSSKHQCHKAKHLSELYTDYNLAYLLFLKPVLAEVQKVNKSFESNSADPTKLFSDLKCLLQSLCSQIVIPDENFDSLSSPLEQFLKSSPQFSYKFELYMRDKIKNGIINENSEQLIRQKCRSFLIKLIEQLRQRLPANMDTLRKIDFLSVDNSLKIVKPNTFSHIKNEKYNYTADEITMIEAQWRNLLNYKWTYTESTVDFWVEVREFKNALQENPFTELLQFVFSFLVLPFSNAEVERLFSTMKIVKTKQRNRIKLKMLNALLNIRCSLKRLQKCCHDFEISDDLIKFLESRDNYTNPSSDSSDDEEIIIPIL